jgi:hypothetical protein
LFFIYDIKDFLHPPDLSTDESHFDPVRVKGRLREDVLYDTSRQSTRRLILLQNDIDLDSRANVLSVLTIHGNVKR